MPQVQNNFLKSRMNKDLDARLLPNGEYRDARDVSISKSEGSDVGALENIRGTLQIENFNLSDKHLEIIGLHSDVSTNKIYCFITNYNDSSTNNLNNHAASFASAKCYIAMYDANSGSGTVLVQGNFLNFSKTHKIYGINIIEDLLFWTDNRNQPRKININKAKSSPSYYNSEDLVSVLKYAPVNSIRFVENVSASNASNVYQPTLIDDTSEQLPPHFTAPAIPNGTRIDFGATGLVPKFMGQLEDYIEITTTASPRYFLRNKTQLSKWYFITSRLNEAVSIGDTPYVSLTTFPSDWSTTNTSPDTYEIAVANPFYNPNFTGDKDYLKDKFVRFSYRFKFEDGEYSLMAPFTQPAFLSKQDGNWLEGDEQKTKQNTIVEFFENKLTTAGCTIDLPYNYDEIYSKLNVTGIDILFKESESTNIKVLDSIDLEDFESHIGAAINSKDPTTLAGGDLNNSTITFASTTAFDLGYHYPTVTIVTGNGKKVRLQVYITANNDIQDIKCTYSGSGFRAGDVMVIPANELGDGSPQVVITLNGNDLVGWDANLRKNQFLYQYKSTEPYKVLPEKATTRVHDKAPIRAMTQDVTGNRVMYGNYVDRNNAPNFIDYSVKINEKFNLDTSESAQLSRWEYPLQTLKQNRTYQVGIVLVDRFGRSSNVLLNESVLTSNNAARDSTIFTSYSNANNDPVEWPGNSLKVVFNGLIPSAKATGGLYSAGNPLGWYSYRVVVKQQDQDYYNVYTPGILAGRIDWDGSNVGGGTGNGRPSYNETKTNANIALLGDNINKVPRNLENVGPLDKSFGSSTVLFCRVNPNSGTVSSDDESIYSTQVATDGAIRKISINSIKQFFEFDKWTTTKGQFYPGKENVVDSTSLGNPDPWYPFYFNPASFPMTPTTVSTIEFRDIFWRSGENPHIATLSTKARIGTIPSYASVNNITIATRQIGIFETKPTRSNLNILWETTTSGLISELNTSINSNATGNGLGGVTEFAFIQRENFAAGVDIVTNEFEVVDSNGNTTADWLSTISLQEVYQGSTTSGPLITDKFQIYQSTAGTPGSAAPRFKIRLSNNAAQTPPDFIYKGLPSNDQFLFVLKITANGVVDNYSFIGDLSNIAPRIDGDAPYSDVIKAKANYLNGTPIALTDLWNKPSSGTWPNIYKSITGGACWDVSQANFNGNSIEIVDFNDEFWRWYDPQKVQYGSTGRWNWDQDVTGATSTNEYYYLQNGTRLGDSPAPSPLSTVNKAERTYGLKVKIIRVDTSTVYWQSSGYNPQWGASNQQGSWVQSPSNYWEKPLTQSPFIVDNSAKRIVTSITNPPSLGGNANNPLPASLNITYRITYKVYEDFTGGQESGEYYAYVRFYETQTD